MQNLVNNIFNKKFAENASNRNNPDENTFANGLGLKSEVVSTNLNGTGFILSEAIQYLQFTGGFYSKDADYSEGNICSLLIKEGEGYSIWQFRRNATNPAVLNNNSPIENAVITTVNGVDSYEGGTLNSDWDLLTSVQEELLAGKNIAISENTISVEGGVSKEYITDLQVYENDLIVYNGKLYIANEDFTATNWDSDLSKLTLVSGEEGGGEVVVDAIDVNYDNSHTNFQKDSGNYDFPPGSRHFFQNGDFRPCIHFCGPYSCHKAGSSSSYYQYVGNFILHSSANIAIILCDNQNFSYFCSPIQ